VVDKQGDKTKEIKREIRRVNKNGFLFSRERQKKAVFISSAAMSNRKYHAGD
jgi:hypothetical protein